MSSIHGEVQSRHAQPPATGRSPHYSLYFASRSSPPFFSQCSKSCGSRLLPMSSPTSTRTMTIMMLIGKQISEIGQFDSGHVVIDVASPGDFARSINRSRRCDQTRRFTSRAKPTNGLTVTWTVLESNRIQGVRNFDPVCAAASTVWPDCDWETTLLGPCFLKTFSP